MRFFGFLFLLIVALLVVGWMRGWVYVYPAGAEAHAEPKVVVDSSKIAADAKGSAAKVESLTSELLDKLRSKSGAAHAADAFEVAATLVAVDATARRVDLRVDEDHFSLAVSSSTTIEVGGAAAKLTDLVPGRSVRARLRIADGATSLQHLAQ